jgi:hypothetical protein
MSLEQHCRKSQHQETVRKKYEIIAQMHPDVSHPTQQAIAENCSTNF